MRTLEETNCFLRMTGTNRNKAREDIGRVLDQVKEEVKQELDEDQWEDAVETAALVQQFDDIVKSFTA